MDLSASDKSAKELNTNGTNLALDVIRTCMVFPLTVVEEVEVDYLVGELKNTPKLPIWSKAPDNAAPESDMPNHKVILIEGTDRVQ